MSKKCSTFAPAFDEKATKWIESVAQQVEHIPFKDGVLGSSPSWFTRREFRLSFLFSFPVFLFHQILLAKLLQKIQICKQIHKIVTRKCFFFFGTEFVILFLHI